MELWVPGADREPASVSKVGSNHGCPMSVSSLCTYMTVTCARVKCMHAWISHTNNTNTQAKKNFLRVKHGPGVVAFNFNPSTLEADRGGSQVSGSAWWAPGQSELGRETLSPCPPEKKKRKRRKGRGKIQHGARTRNQPEKLGVTRS